MTGYRAESHIAVACNHLLVRKSPYQPAKTENQCLTCMPLHTQVPNLVFTFSALCSPQIPRISTSSTYSSTSCCATYLTSRSADSQSYLCPYSSRIARKLPHWAMALHHEPTTQQEPPLFDHLIVVNWRRDAQVQDLFYDFPHKSH